MKEAFTDPQGYVHAGGPCLFSEPGGIVPHEFVTTHINQQGRQAFQIPVQRRYERQAGIVFSGVIFGKNGLSVPPAQCVQFGTILLRSQGTIKERRASPAMASLALVGLLP